MAEVRYLTWTDEGLLRQPVFLRLRDDKRPEECPMPPGREATGCPRAALPGARACAAPRDADAGPADPLVARRGRSSSG